MNGVCAEFELKKKKNLIADIAETKVAKIDKNLILPYDILKKDPNLIKELKQINPMKAMGIPGFNFTHVVISTEDFNAPNLIFTQDIDKVKKSGLWPYKKSGRKKVDFVYGMADGWYATWIILEKIGYPELL